MAAGQAILANTNQRAVGGFNMGLFLVSVAGLIVSSVMFQSNSFSRLTAYVGILANALSLADYLRKALAPSATVALVVILPKAVFLVIRFVFVGRRLYRLGRLERKTLPYQFACRQGAGQRPAGLDGDPRLGRGFEAKPGGIPYKSVNIILNSE